MKLYIDCEFNGFGGELISMGIVDENGRVFYQILRHDHLDIHSWVKENVIPILGPQKPLNDHDFRVALHAWLMHYKEDMEFIADWPDDIKFICQYLLTGPGTMMPTTELITFRVDRRLNTSFSTVPHNAVYDAAALRECANGLS